MSDSYPIIDVTPALRLNDEQMGSKEKFWCRHPEEENGHWLFKYPQPGTGQHWAEKIAAEIASILQICHAQADLARFEQQQGSLPKSFSYGEQVLHHGNQMLEKAVRAYDPDKKFRQTDHTLENIWTAMEASFAVPAEQQAAKRRMAEYFVLDALIGNTDRHHENWGILRTSVDEAYQGIVAPSFDHASSLGRELQDARRDMLLAEGRVGNYVEKGHGGIYWSGDEKRAPSPLALVRQAARRYPDSFLPALGKLEKLEENRVADLVERVPDGWMSRSARKFTTALIHYNMEQLAALQ